MKILIFIIFILLSNSDILHPACADFEWCLYNNTGHEIFIYLYPVSMVFNGLNMYNLIAKDSNPGNLYHNDYIHGTTWHNGEEKYYFIGGGGYDYDAFDYHLYNSNGHTGYGIYKLQIRHMLSGNDYYEDSCLIEFDYFELFNGIYGDLAFYVNDRYQRPRFAYQFVDQNHTHPLIEITYSEPKNYKIEIWKPNGPDAPPVREKRYGPPNGENYDGFYTYKIESSSLERFEKFKGIIPLDCRMDCNVILHENSIYNNQNHKFPWNYYDNHYEIRQGDIPFNLHVKRRIKSPIFVWDFYDAHFSIPLNILPNVTLKLDSSYILNSTSCFDHPEFYMTAKQNSNLILAANDTIIINDKAIFTFDNGSNLRIGNNSYFRVKRGGVFCNKGVNILEGLLKVRYEGGCHYLQCDYATDYIINDSTQIFVADSDTLVIPDNLIVHFCGANTLLSIDSNCTVKIGANSKLVFQDGARLNAYKANFTSINANSIWHGIYLEDSSKDTIRYCNIENAVSGINIKDKYNSGGTPGMDPVTIITDCSFKNTTSNTFSSGIYVNNSNNILLKNNSFISTNINIGFSSGILLEYCPAGNINLINNNVDYSANGVVVIQSSPYISRNTITGRTNSNYGIFLDNAGGNIKYNTVNNFATSYISYYSSPNLFRNSFLNASKSNLELLTYSTPLMRPVNTESEIIWLGGNNIISGTPAISGIEFYEESYPELDLGYNIENVNGADYMKGDIPTVMDGMLFSTYNYWGTSNPDPNKFDVQYGNVEYQPIYDGVTPIYYDDYQMNDIGFGFYDTVLIKNLGDISGGTLLFMQAYNKEKQSDYSGAILLYKQVISSYKKSYYAAASLMGIFSCLEKIKNINNFILHQNFLSQLKTNNKIPLIIRELSEDYIIKCKVKRGMLTEAISDYNNIYMLNQSNSKGEHALLNKECLTSMLHDTTDGMSGDIIEHKYNIYEKITNKSLNHNYLIKKEGKSAQYSLSDNYPNPFNPVTNIGYELPNDAFVKIRIFDILGREVTVLVNEFKSAGRYISVFNASNLPSGIYFYKLEAKEQSEIYKTFNIVKKMLLVK